MNDDNVLETARVVRPLLPGLLGSEPEMRAVAGAMDLELGDLLEQASRGEEVEERILDTLCRHPSVYGWSALVLPTGLPPEATVRMGLPGFGEALRSAKYSCPVAGDVVWYRHSVGQPIPLCNSHGVPLEPVSGEVGG